MTDHDPRLDALLRWSLFGVAASQALTGMLSFVGWFVPRFTEGIMPAWFVDPIRDSGLSTSAVLDIVHWILGGLLAAGTIAYGVLWYLGRVRPAFLDRGVETATSAFWRWVLGLFSRHRDSRLRFRDALLLPRLEFAVVLAVATVTSVLRWIPGFIGEGALALHRINAMYLTFLGIYALSVLALARRGDSPYPTVIIDGRVHHRRTVHYE